MDGARLRLQTESIISRSGIMDGARRQLEKQMLQARVRELRAKFAAQLQLAGFCDHVMAMRPPTHGRASPHPRTGRVPKYKQESRNSQ